jgi:hypothetical protein
MKKMLVAATTVGAAIAGVTLYLQKKSRSRNELKANNKHGIQPSAEQIAIDRGTNTMG